MIDVVRILGQTQMFQELSPADLQEIADNGHVKHFKAGFDLYQTGDSADAIFITLDGWLKFFRVSPNGGETVIRITTTSETFAESAVFGNPMQYPTSAQAIEDTTVLEIPRNWLTKKISSDPKFSLNILKGISTRQCYLIHHVEELASSSAPQRLGAFLLRLHHTNPSDENIIQLPYDKSLLASRLGMQPETFSRALSKLSKFDITTKGRTISIGKPDDLARFCEIDNDNLCMNCPVYSQCCS